MKERSEMTAGRIGRNRGSYSRPAVTRYSGSSLGPGLGARSKQVVYGMGASNPEATFIRSCLESTPESGRSVRSSPVSGFARSGQASLLVLKQNMLQAALARTTHPLLQKWLCGVANAAAEIAWETDFPTLVFPALFEEMAQSICGFAPREAEPAAGAERCLGVPEAPGLAQEVPRVSSPVDPAAEDLASMLN